MKTTSAKIITGILFFIFHFSFFISMRAQTDTAGRRKMCDLYINRSKYIFQGKLISVRNGVRIKTGEHTSSNYNFYLMQVDKVIKGDLLMGTIEIIGCSDPSTYYDNGEIQRFISDDRDPNQGIPASEGIYFSYKNYRGILKDSSDANTNMKSIQLNDEIPLHNGDLVKEKRGITKYFTTLSDFYDYISANYGVKIEDK
jgi:hypothetical protein